MELTLYQVDAFTSQLFAGNPAAVCPLTSWLPDERMQAIAQENNLSETAFLVPEGADFHIRWFTPVREVNLCGHATLASAWVLFEQLGYAGEQIRFQSRSGELLIKRGREGLVMNFPAQPPAPVDIPAEITAAFQQPLQACLQSEDYLAVFEKEADVAEADPDMAQLKKLDLRGVIITAPSDRFDFVSRFFAPKYGIDEDPVTGSAYTQLAPYWAARLNTRRFRVRQLSARGGDLTCELAGDRVLIEGTAVLYMKGTICLNP